MLDFDDRFDGVLLLLPLGLLAQLAYGGLNGRETDQDAGHHFDQLIDLTSPMDHPGHAPGRQSAA